MFIGYYWDNFVSDKRPGWVRWPARCGNAMVQQFSHMAKFPGADPVSRVILEVTQRKAVRPVNWL